MNPETSLRPAVVQPARVVIQNDSQGAKLIQRWFSFRFIPLAIFTAFWDGLLIIWYTIALVEGAPWIMLAFPAVHLAIGIGLTYYTIAGFINRTVLEISPGTISVWFEPLPWFGKKKLRTSEIRQLYCKEKISRSKNGVTIRYVLYAVTSAEVHVMLLGGLDNKDTAVFFEQQLERWLNIQDHPVAGEIPR